MTLEQMKALANRQTGLVAMVVKRSFAPWKIGDIAGFPPEVAVFHYNEKVAELYDPARPPVRVAPPAPKKPPADAAASSGKPAGSDAVTGPEIAADWETQHYLKRISKAQEIDPTWKPPVEKPGEAANEVIRLELQRRASLLKSPAAA